LADFAQAELSATGAARAKKISKDYRWDTATDYWKTARGVALYRFEIWEAPLSKVPAFGFGVCWPFERFFTVAVGCRAALCGDRQEISR
jgi:hypothetical protein